MTPTVEPPAAPALTLTRTITPFAFVTSKDHNAKNEITFYLDDVHFVMGDAK